VWYDSGERRKPRDFSIKRFSKNLDQKQKTKANGTDFRTEGTNRRLALGEGVIMNVGEGRKRAGKEKKKFLDEVRVTTLKSMVPKSGEYN